MYKDWVDSYDVCTFLKISERTLQRLRIEGVITYSQIAGKTYYRIVEIRRILNDRLIRCDADRLNDLITGHKEYLAQRRRNKPKSK